MKKDDKVKIANSLINIKLALSQYNTFLNNAFDVDKEFEQLKLAFDGTKDIAIIIRNN